MPDESTPLRPDYRALLSKALREIREDRRLRIADMARLMGMSASAYDRFEAGNTRLDIDDLLRFAEVTDSDPFGILAGVLLKAPEFGVRTADNKLMAIFMLALRDFHAELRDDIALIEPRLLVGAFRRVFEDLREQVRSRDLSAETWLETATNRAGLNLSFRRGFLSKKRWPGWR